MTRHSDPVTLDTISSQIGILHDDFTDFKGICKGKHDGLDKEIVRLDMKGSKNQNDVSELMAGEAFKRKVLGDTLKWLGDKAIVPITVILSLIVTTAWNDMRRKDVAVEQRTQMRQDIKEVASSREGKDTHLPLIVKEIEPLVAPKVSMPKETK